MNSLRILVLLSLTFSLPAAAQQFEGVPLAAPQVTLTVTPTLVGTAIVSGPLPLVLNVNSPNGVGTVTATLVDDEIELAISLGWIEPELRVGIELPDVSFDVPVVAGETRTTMLFDIEPVSSDRVTTLLDNYEWQFGPRRYASALLGTVVALRSRTTSLQFSPFPPGRFELFVPGDTIDTTADPASSFAAYEFNYDLTAGSESFNDVYRLRARALLPATTMTAGAIGPWGVPLLAGLLLGLGVRMTWQRTRQA